MLRVIAGWSLFVIASCDAAAPETPTVEPGPNATPATAPGEPTEARPESEAATPVEAPTKPSFVEELNLRKPKADAIDGAVSLFVKHFTAATPAVDEAARLEAIQALFAFTERALEDPAASGLLDSDEIYAAACRSVGHCDAGDPTPAAVAKVEALRDSGVTFAYAGEGTLVVAADYGRIAEKIRPGLSALARTYLETIDFQGRKVDERYDEPGFVGDADDMAEAIVRWETLGKRDPAYTKVAREHTDALATQYLRICDQAEYQEPECIVTKRLRGSYQRSVREQATSRYQPAVAGFLAEMKRRKYRADSETLERVIESQLSSVTAAKSE